MALRLPDRWLWDFWVVPEGDRYHVFYLQAPRSLEDPDQRHWNVSVGHAVSTDLAAWEVLADALHPGADGEWDDYTTWTGSVIRHVDRWAMLYTGTTHREHGLIQRIGLAWSDDLVHWVKDSANPVLAMDPKRYDQLDLARWHDQAWRDPWVFLSPTDGDYHAFMTARVPYGDNGGRGVIAHAVSEDLRRWTVCDPVTAPGVFGHMEIPQLVESAGRWYLLFSTPGQGQPSSLIGRSATLTGTHYLSAASPLGPFEWSSHGVLAGDSNGTKYGVKLVMTYEGEWVALAWENLSSNGDFVGELGDPMPVSWDQGPRLEPRLRSQGEKA